VDTTVVETNIHYPTDSSLLGDGVRVLTRTMKRIEEEVGRVGTRARNWTRSVTHRLIEIGKATRGEGEEGKERQKKVYRKLMAVTRKVSLKPKPLSARSARGSRRLRTGKAIWSWRRWRGNWKKSVS